MRTADCFLSIVVPLQDDGDIAESFLTELLSVLREHFENYEVVVVDDGSVDETRRVLGPLLEREEGLRLLRLSRSFGLEIAISAGLDSVIGDFIAVMLPDSDPPEVLPEMVRLARESGGTVVGIRESEPNESALTRAAAAAFHWYCNRALQLDIPRNGAILRVMSRQAVNAVTRIGDRLRYIRAFTGYVGYDRKEFPYRPVWRRGTPTKRGFWQALGTGIDVIVSNSTHPLRFVSGLGLAASIFSALYVGYVFVAHLLASDVPPGWVTRSVQTSVLFFFLFLIVTVLCEYVGRILAEIQQRPLYFVSEEVHSTPTIEAAERRNVASRSVETP